MDFGIGMLLLEDRSISLDALFVLLLRAKFGFGSAKASDSSVALCCLRFSVEVLQTIKNIKPLCFKDKANKRKHI